MNLDPYVDQAVTIMEATGVTAMLLGAVVAAGVTANRMRADGMSVAYPLLRKYLGRAILIGLEFLVAADIIRTISTTPQFDQVAVLAIIVVIRTFLSLALEVEIEGPWPWGGSNGAPR